MAAKIIKWGIIGCGDVAEVKSGPAFQKASQSELAAVMRRSGDKARDFARRHHVKHWYDDASELLRNPEINAVYIATPPDSHVEYVLQAIAAGKDVYLEKPIARSSEEAYRISKALEGQPTKLTVAHYRRMMDAFRKAKQLLDEDAIGKVRLVDIRILQPARSDLIAETAYNWRLDPAVSGGGYFWDLAPHQIDLMLSWFGPPARVHGFGVNQENEKTPNDMVQGIMEFQNRLQFRGAWAFNVAESDQMDRCTIYGSEGSIRFSFFGAEVHLVRPDSTEHFQFPTLDHVQQPMINATVQYFLGNGDNPCSIEEAIRGMQVMEGLSGR